MTTTKKKRRKKSVKKLKYSNKKLNFVHVATLAGVILILLVIILAARGCGDQPQNPGGACGKLYQGCGRRQGQKNAGMLWCG